MTDDRARRYRVLEEIGRGAMGIVHRAEDTVLRRMVALKFLSTEDAEDEDRRRRFVREARVAAAITHPNVASVYDAGEAEGRVFLAMELLAGVTLRARLDRKAIGTEEAVRIARDIALGLASAHAAGVVHRDLKPENVMLTTDGQTKVLDFGVAKLRPAEPPSGVEATLSGPATRPGLMIGTPAYMSPEQAKGRDVDEKTDVFALGVVLYEMLAGRRPFTGTPMEILIAIDRDEARALDDLVPEPLVRLVTRCLAKSPEERPMAREVAAALDSMRSSPRSTAPRRFGGYLLGAASAAIVLGIAIAVSAIGGAPVRANEARASTDAGPPRHPLEIAGWGPIPKSERSDAIVAFTTGLSELRGGSISAQVHFERALAIDPTLAAADLRLAVIYGFTLGGLDSARKHLANAQRGRARLVDVDVAMLDAIEPTIAREPPDQQESLRRLDAATSRFPSHIELGILHAAFLTEAGEGDLTPRALARWRRLVALDPDFGRGLSIVGQFQAYAGDFDAARASFDECVRAWPRSQACLMERATLDGELGGCDAVEAAARTMVETSPTDIFPRVMLGGALSGNDAPPDKVREAFAEARRREGSAHWTPAIADFLVDFREGNFDMVIRGARQLDADLADVARVAQRAPATVYLMSALREVGRNAEAADAADSFVRKSRAWESVPRAEDTSLEDDPEPYLWIALRGDGRISREELSRRRTAWIEAFRARQKDAFMRRYLWFHAYAKTSYTAEDAREALEVLPAYEPLPPYRPSTIVEAHVGRTYVLAGRAAEAIPWLERATRKCVHPGFAVDQTPSFYWLGRARAETGDRAGACAAYEAVVRKWGGAPKSRSLTLANARKEIDSLGCAAREGTAVRVKEH